MPILRRLLVALIVLFCISNHAFGIKNFVLISAPGSGKGTFSQYMVKKYGYVQICPGDIFRSEIALGTELGKQIQSVVDRGDYVEEDIVCKLIQKHIDEACSQDKGFILDGFPRSVVSFEYLDSLLKTNNLEATVCFLQFDASDTVCVKRIVKRLVCMNCFRVYNALSKQPECWGSCDNCGAELSSRKADTKIIVEKRLEYFHSNIEPLMLMAEQYYKVKKINSESALANLELEYEKLFKD